MLIVDDAAGAVGRMTVINADGSLAKMCGNGLRTVARYLSEKTGQQQFTVQTEEAALRVRHVADFAAGVPGFSVEISPVSFASSALPFAALGTDKIVDQVLPALDPALRFTAVAVPNPHLIAFVSEAELNGEKIGALGKKLNAPNPYFPEGSTSRLPPSKGRTPCSRARMSVGSASPMRAVPGWRPPASPLC